MGRDGDLKLAEKIAEARGKDDQGVYSRDEKARRDKESSTS